jgi:hypothetical protein
VNHLLVLANQRLERRMIAVSALRNPVDVFVRIGHAV